MWLCNESDTTVETNHAEHTTLPTPSPQTAPSWCCKRVLNSLFCRLLLKGPFAKNSACFSLSAPALPAGQSRYLHPMAKSADSPGREGPRAMYPSGQSSHRHPMAEFADSPAREGPRALYPSGKSSHRHPMAEFADIPPREGRRALYPSLSRQSAMVHLYTRYTRYTWYTWCIRYTWYTMYTRYT